MTGGGDSVITTELLARYDRPGPRYTSYPTAPVWNDAFGPRDYAARLAEAGTAHGEPLSLYVHIPYCESLCWYCACSVVITQDQSKGDRYVDDVLREARLVHETMGAPADRHVVQHHWGGGTPTFLSPDAMTRLFTGLRALFPLAEDAEVSIEVDPRVTRVEHLEALAAVGFNRISMGVQDFDPKVQEAVHRVQSVALTRDLVEAARGLGFRSVNVDLVYGLPYQTAAGFTQSLRTVAEQLQPDRIACYSYAHVPWLKKHQELIPTDALPSADAKLGLFQLALREFAAHGYEAIGMDHFARHDDELAIAAREHRLHRNFMGYTTRPADDMLSLGVSAISEVRGAFAQNHKSVTAWREALDRGETPTERGHQRSADDEARRRVILDLMCRFRLRLADYGGADAFHDAYGDALDALAPMAEDGLVAISSEGLDVLPAGRLLVRNLCMPFDAYLPKAKPGAGDGAPGRFSRTV